MELIGMLDSPFVRRVAVTAQFLGIRYEHNPLSIFKGYDEFRVVNPLVKVPTLITDDDVMLVDSTLIIDYLESLCENGNSLPRKCHCQRARYMGSPLRRSIPPLPLPLFTPRNSRLVFPATFFSRPINSP